MCGIEKDSAGVEADCFGERCTFPLSCKEAACEEVRGLTPSTKGAPPESLIGPPAKGQGPERNPARFRQSCPESGHAFQVRQPTTLNFLPFRSEAGTDVALGVQRTLVAALRKLSPAPLEVAH